ncbi:RagB/SusD family nutrient uptake outer membrane protein [Polaribacter cellanae]|uniref:RagB/SusD family nutrient uptake outer membrane protein n=1 Tax=Polaribacter cellanae TaxID=2818493 RepID=A0A975CMW9_9FLAO|nr:RagB/SusD family nutrient uptake outer membrane protein [Polaribacter cellanae]QTE22563.1 RagB/SusD family nutrient uptake outer membrane protein [Polaribacter cellanae]
MKTYIYSVLFIFLLSCSKDYLDIVPKGFVMLTKVEDYRLMLDQIDRKGDSNGFFYCSDNDQYLSDEVKITDDYNKVSPSRYNRKSINQYLWKDNSVEINQNFRDLDWDALFNQIYISNIVINGVLGAKGKVKIKEQLLAEAKTHRAYAYLVLVNLYSKHYNPTTSNADLGVPLLTEAILEGSLKRATVQQTYDFILEDLKTSIKALPDFPEWNHRPSKASVYALLARTYLYMGDFNKALTFSNKSLTIYSSLINYTQLPATSIVSLYPNLVSFPTYHENTEVLLAKGRLSVAYLPTELSDTHLALFDTANDIRYKGVFAKDFVAPSFITVAFDGQLGQGIRLIGPSVPEMMLTKAECLARQGDITAPIDIVNDLRKKRIENVVDLGYPATSNEALRIVKDERRREFTNKGLRWYDIKRYNVYDNANITLTRTYKGETQTLAPGDNRWVFPIAKIYTSLNPELEPNP